MKAARTTPPAPADAEKQLKAFIGKFDPKDQQLIRAVRRALRKWFPTANELVWDKLQLLRDRLLPDRTAVRLHRFDRRSGKRSRPVLYPWRKSSRSHEVVSRLRQSDSLHSP